MTVKPIGKRKFLKLLKDKQACPRGYERARTYLKKHTVLQLISYYYRCREHRYYHREYRPMRDARTRDLTWLESKLQYYSQDYLVICIRRYR